LRILRGGSAEVRPNNWFKFDIELDESDLQAIVIKYNLDLPKMTVIEKYRVLTKQAELLATLEMERQGAVGQFSAQDIKTDLDTIISKLPKVD
jgi:hypothetical protein